MAPDNAASKRRARQSQHDAVSALGAGAVSSTWTVERIVARLIDLYEEHINRAATSTKTNKPGRSRIETAMASVPARLLEHYYQDLGEADNYALWSHRRNLTETRAYTRHNAIANSIGGGRTDIEE